MAIEAVFTFRGVGAEWMWEGLLRFGILDKGTFEYIDPNQPGTISFRFSLEDNFQAWAFVISGEEKGSWNCWLKFASILEFLIIIPEKYHEALERAIEEKKPKE